MSGLPDVVTFSPDTGEFQPTDGFIKETVGDPMHPVVAEFLNLTTSQIVDLYMSLKPQADRQFLEKLISCEAKHFRWTGVDLIPTYNQSGKTQMTVIETNSCSSGNQWMAYSQEYNYEGYRRVAVDGFVNWLKELNIPPSEADLAVLLDMPKNRQECSIYARLIAKDTGENVHLVDLKTGVTEFVRWSPDGLLTVKSPAGWRNIRAAFRKVVQIPWTKIPVNSETKIFNPIVACLAGGRNKAIAHQAYEQFNKRFSSKGIEISLPWTQVMLKKSEIPAIAANLNYKLVVKQPYSNSGLDVFIITNKAQLDELLARKFPYDLFMVQTLICHPGWLREGESGENNLFARCCTFEGNPFLYDIRLMLISTAEGWRPTAICGRRPPLPLPTEIPSDGQSLSASVKTNLRQKDSTGVTKFQVERLIPFGVGHFPALHLNLVDLVESFVQAVMASVALDSFCAEMLTESGQFRAEIFAERSQDESLVREVQIGENLKKSI